MVVLRLKRMGRTHRPFYRVCAMDKRVPVDGKTLEEIGWYDPVANEERQLRLKMDRIDYWLSVGAQPSDTVRDLIRKAGGDPTPGKKYEPPKAEPARAATAESTSAGSESPETSDAPKPPAEG
jgi:small subunit ribosomal protein S16